ncbi:MAG: PaaI family thioesterase [Rhodobacteraceae bacterium]|nr:PaaI family thioesterase [Paracoccaceae bacterium]
MRAIMSEAEIVAFWRAEFPQVSGEFTLDRLTDDGLVLRMQVQERHLRPGGTVSGPAMFGLADVAFYLALLSRIGPVGLAVTTNIAMDFLRKPMADADLLGQARLLKVGRSLAVGDVMIFSEGQSEPVARASLTYAIPPRKQP